MQTLGELVLVRLGGCRYALPMASVAEVGRPPGLTRVPGLPSWVAGVANWRGRVLAVLDLRGPTACELFTPADRDNVLARLGPDPLRKDADPDLAWARLSRSRTAIGALLMDQSVLAGIGNVYRAEVLFRAGLSPFRLGREVPERIWEQLWEDTRQLLRAGVRAGGITTTEREDRHRRTGPARRDDRTYVYRRDGLPCRRCGTQVRTQVMVGRNLFWCPVCQPE